MCVSPTHQAMNYADPELHTNDQIFPKLPSSKKKVADDTPDPLTSPVTQTLDSPNHFIWRSKPLTMQPEVQEGGGEIKGKAIAKSADLTPITRQGYRSRRLADNFWSTLNPHNTPTSPARLYKSSPSYLQTTIENRRNTWWITKAHHTSPLLMCTSHNCLLGYPGHRQVRNNTWSMRLLKHCTKFLSLLAKHLIHCKNGNMAAGLQDGVSPN